MNVYVNSLNTTNSTTTNLTTTNTTATYLLVTNPIINNTQSYGILRGATSQSINSAQSTEMTTYYTGGTNVVSGYITNPNNGRLQVSKAGVYLCTAQVSWANGAVSERSCWFFINSSGGPGLATNRCNAPSGSGTCQNISTCLLLAANDYVSVYGYQASGGALGQDIGIVTLFTMSRVL